MSKLHTDWVCKLLLNADNEELLVLTLYSDAIFTNLRQKLPEQAKKL